MAATRILLALPLSGCVVRVGGSGPTGDPSGGGGSGSGDMGGGGSGSGSGTFAAMTNECLQAGDATSNHLEIATCIGQIAQGFGVIHNSDGTISIAHDHDCVDVAGSNGTGAQKWIQQADGSLMNPESGKCAGLPAGTSHGSSLQLAPCGGSASQRLSPL